MKDFPKKLTARDEAIEATAAAWLAQRDAGLTPDEQSAFAQWRRADAQHEAAVARLELAWGALQPLRDFRPEARRHPDRDLLRPPSARRVARFPAFATLAAAAALALAATWWFVRPSRTPAQPQQDYATTVGSYQRVVLADGSILELNASSAVNVRFTPAERRVRLTRGEAHFTVAKDLARPFWVEAGAVAVRAVGTAFNVRLGANDVEVLVTEGKVEVGQKISADEAAGTQSHSGNAQTSSAPGAAPVVVEANQRVLMPVSPPRTEVVAPNVEKVSLAAVQEALTWQGPRLVFADTPLADVIAQFNRRNQVQLSLGDPELAALPVGGSFRAENLDAFVRLFESSPEFVVERPDAHHIILRKRK